jgi:hypothetical protein
MLRTLRDVVSAVDDGRIHTQRFLKNPQAVGADNRWFDWSFASGQPAFDARIGNALEFTPCVAQRNDAVYFPSVSVGMERRLLGVDLYTGPTSTGQARVQTSVCDLVGYYPLIDGDSTDDQDMDNTATLPRYIEGRGVIPVLVNHVAPSLITANLIVTYTNSDGVSGRVATWPVQVLGTGVVSNGAGLTPGQLGAVLQSGDTGVLRIDSVRFDAAPGGLFALYLIKPLTTVLNRMGEGLGLAGMAEKQIAITDGYRLPLVPDGAWLTMFYMTSGSARTASLFGNMHFVWG